MPAPERPARGAELARELADAARALRDGTPMRPEWRDEVVRAVEAAGPPEPAPRGGVLGRWWKRVMRGE